MKAMLTHHKLSNAIRSNLKKFLLLMLFWLAANPSVFATVSITKANASVSADKAANALAPAFTTIGIIKVTEVAATDFAVGTGLTFTVGAPAGWEFNPSAAVSITATAARDITGATVVSQTSSLITFQFNVNGNTLVDAITITGVQVRALDGAKQAVGVNMVSGGTAVITGCANGTSLGTLITAAGTGRLVIVLPGQTCTDGLTQASSGMTGSVTTQIAGTSFNLSKVINCDQFYNVITTYTGSKTLTYSGPSAANTSPTYTTTVVFSAGKSTSALVTNLKKAQTTTLTVTDGTVIGTPSSSITVYPAALNYFTVEANGGGAIPDQTSGVPFPIQVTARDFENNILNGGANNFNGTATLTSTGDLTVGSGITPAFTSGVLSNYSVAIGSGGVFTITATSGLPTGSSSSFNVNNPIPDISSLSPACIPTGSGDLVLTVNGTNFSSNSIVQIDGFDRNTTFISSTQLTADIYESDLAIDGVFYITVVTPAPLGGSSSAWPITVSSAPVIDVPPVDQYLCEGGTATFEVAATGVGMSYQWKRNGISLNDGGRVDGASTPTLTIDNVTSLDASASFTVAISSDCYPVVNSSPVTLTVDPITIGGTLSGSTSVCSEINSGILLLSGYEGTILQWESSNDNFATVADVIQNTGNSYIYNHLTEDTYFRVLVQSGMCSPEYSSVASITLVPVPEVPFDPIPTIAQCGDTMVTLNRDNSPVDEVWYWQSSEDGVSTADSSLSLDVYANGTYYLRSQSTLTGCWSPGASSVSVILPEISNVSQDVSVCEGTIVDLPDGSTTDVSGVFQSYFTSSQGCDSIITTNVTVNPLSNSTSDISICEGASLVLPDGIEVFSEGTYFSTVLNSNGCDSVITTNLTLIPSSLAEVEVSICDGTSYNLPDGSVATTDGVYTYHMSTVGGCDSVIATTVTVMENTESTNDVFLCDGNNTMLPDGQVVNSAGTYTSHLTNEAGCDSVVITTISTANSTASSAEVFICSGDVTYLPDGSPAWLDGIYHTTIPNEAGCDSIITTTVTVYSSNPSFQTVDICNGTFYVLPDGAEASIDGWYTSIIPSVHGCDSTIQTYVNILPLISSSQSMTVCDGSTVTLPDGNVVSDAGDYTSVLVSATGCDSVVTTTVIVTYPTDATVSATICDGTTYNLPDGATATTSGVYSSVIPNAAGCDSTITTELMVEAPSETSVDVFICQGDSVMLLDGSYVSDNGAYAVTLPSEHGCDSVIVTNVTVNEMSADYQTATICSGDTYTLPDGSTASIEGTFISILTNELGCDSVITTDLTVNEPSSDELFVTLCSGSNYTLVDGTDVNTTGVYTRVIPNEVGCDSTVIVHLTVVQSTSSTRNVVVCSGSELILPDGSIEYPLVTGNYTSTIPNANGCDSVITTHAVVKVLPTLISNATQIRCFGGTGSVIIGATGGVAPYTYNSTPRTNLTEGTYVYTVADGNGCVDTAIIVINPAPSLLTLTATPTQIQCYNGRGSVSLQGNGGTTPYLYGGASQSNLTAGNYHYTVTDSRGCTASANASITPGPTKLNSSVTTTSSLCSSFTGTATANPTGGTPPYSFQWNSNPAQYTNPATNLAAGAYVVTVSDSRGCTVNANATVASAAAPRLLISGIQSICPGGTTTICASAGMTSYLWSNGDTTQCSTFANTGAYTVTVSNAAGCTTSTTVNITQGAVPVCSITGNDFICPNSTTTLTAPYGNTYKWNTGSTRQYIAVRLGGTYSVTVKNAAGCTSTCSKVISAPMKATIKNTNGSCVSGFKGSSTVTVMDGTPPYTYQWSNGNTTATATGMNAGAFNVRVTDANGCSTTLNLTMVITKSSVDYSRIVSSFNSNDIAANNYIWFSAVATVNYSGAYPIEVYFTDQNIACSRFNVNPVKARLIIDDTYTQATTVYANGEWLTMSPPSANGNYFISGYSYKAPTLILRNLNSITWKGIWSASKPGITSVDWKWSAAVYSNFSTDCSLLGVKPIDDANGSIYTNSDPAGSPENFTANVVAGARGLANGDYVGSYTSAVSRIPCSNTVFSLAGSRMADNFSDMSDDNILVKAYPNPFSSHATIEFARNDRSTHAAVEIYNLSGQKIARLFDGMIEAGQRYTAEFNGSDLAEGIYVYRISMNDKVLNGRLILVK